MMNWWESCQHGRQETKDTYMSVLIARRLMVLLRNLPRNSGHRNRVVKSSVMKLQGVRMAIETLRRGSYRS